jgi:hypothetical protein
MSSGLYFQCRFFGVLKLSEDQVTISEQEKGSLYVEPSVSGAKSNPHIQFRTVTIEVSGIQLPKVRS